MCKGVFVLLETTSNESREFFFVMNNIISIEWIVLIPIVFVRIYSTLLLSNKFDK